MPNGGQWFINFFTYWIAYSHMIPISLYVVIELLKIGQAKVINGDVKMYYKDDGYFGLCRNSDLIEEMGCVEFVFSDKTGTLTQNKMEFKKISVNGKVYGQPGKVINEGMSQDSVDQIQTCMQAYQDGQMRESWTQKQGPPAGDPLEGKHLHEYFNLMAVCHTVVCDVDVKTKKMQYQASSPDELALSQGAKQVGYELIARSANEITIMNKLT